MTSRALRVQHRLGEACERRDAQVMEGMAALLARHLSGAMFRHLSIPERLAVIEVVKLTVVPEGRAPDADRRAVRLVLLGLSWARQPETAAAAAELDRSGVQVSRLESSAALWPLGRSVARYLDSEPLRESVLRLMIGLAFADGATAQEAGVLDPVRMAFGIRGARAGDIAAGLTRELYELIA